MKRTIAKLTLSLLALGGSIASTLGAPGDIYAGGLNSHAIYVFNRFTGQRTIFVSRSDLNVGRIAFDRFGSLFAASGQSILKLTPNGTITTFAIGIQPNDLAFNNAGNLFVLDGVTNSVLKYTPNGVKTTFAGPLSSAPLALAFGPTGDLYVTLNNGSVLKITANGTVANFASGLNQPFGIAVDAAGNVYVSDIAANTVFKFNSAGTAVSFPAGVGINQPNSLTFDRFGNLYVYENGAQQLIKITPAGNVSNFGQSSFVGGLAIAPLAKGDFNSDGFADYLLYNSGTRQSAIWYLQGTLGTTFIGGAYGPTLPPGWSIVYATDVNLDGKPDYVLFNASTRQTAVWFLNGTILSGGVYGPTLPVGWSLVAAPDINNDRHPDYLLFNASTRQTAVWYLNGTTLTGGVYGPTLPAGWKIIDASDFNNDGQLDYLLFNATTRQTAVWYLNGTTLTGGVYGPTLPTGWSLTGSADFNRDGKPDYGLFNAGTRQTAAWYLNGVTLAGGAYGPPLPIGWALIFP
jgi:hypothetical protein